MKTETTVPPVPLKRRVVLAIGLPVWVLVSFIVATLLVGLFDELLRATNLVGVDAINLSIRNTIIAALVYVLTLLIVIGVPLKWRDSTTTKEELGLSRLPNWSDIAWAPAGFIAYTVVATVLLVAVAQFFPGFDAEQAQEVGFEHISQNYEYILAFVTIVIFAPVAEEILIRGYLYGKLRKVVPYGIAMLISSLLFSLMHFQWNVAVSVFPLAIIMVALREMTGSIWAGVLLHMLKNGIAFYLLFVNPLFPSTMVG